MNTIPRLNIHQRLQHAVLILTASAAFFSGHAVGRGSSGAGLGFDRLYHYHTYAGFAAAFVLLYHVVYIFVRGYVEGRNWPTFPLAWTRADWKGTPAALRHAFGGTVAPPGEGSFRYSQKVLYWVTALLIALLGITGILVAFWESLSTFALLPLLSSLHRGCGLLLVAVFLWHLYGVLTWKGRFSVQWSWIGGGVAEDYAREALPGFYRAWQREEEARQAVMGKKSEDAVEDEERRQERNAVEQDLETGNALAREEKYVDALFHYRRALEKYPGYSQARFNMAVVLTRMGEKVMAKEQFGMFVREDPFHPLARKAQDHIADIESEEA